MYSAEDYERVVGLIGTGLGDRPIARLTGIPRSTIHHWRSGGSPLTRRPVMVDATWRPDAPDSYCYLLGLYLGDGHITTSGDYQACLRLTLDETYPELVQEAREAIVRNAPEANACRYDHGKGRTVILQAAHPVWRYAFPQHGPGKKHERPIRLEPWQQELTEMHPREFLRGLIHSDGCRTTNRFKTSLPSGRVREYAYTRYFFSNLSADIRAIFCDHCELLGIRWTQSNPRNISVSHRASIALLDSFIGPKA